MNLLLAAAMAAALACPAPQEAPLPADPPPAAAAQTEAAAPAPPPDRTVCTYETVDWSDVPERICRTVLNLRLVRLPATEATAPDTTQETPTIASAGTPGGER